MEWSPESWKGRPAAQQVGYGNTQALARVMSEMAALPPLVTSWEIEDLRSQLAKAASGEAFLLQGGDCAESFDDCRSEPIAASGATMSKSTTRRRFLTAAAPAGRSAACRRRRRRPVAVSNAGSAASRRCCR